MRRWWRSRLPVFASPIPEMLVPYADAASLMLANLDRGQEVAVGTAKRPESGIIEVRVAELSEVFHAIDPSPYRDRELDPGVEEFIVTQAADLPSAQPIGLRVYVDRPPNANDAADLVSGIHTSFGRRAATARRELRELLRRGRVNLIIGLAFLGVLGGLAQVLGATTDGGALFGIARESLLIGGWVAMWRPMEMLLYDWWPIRAQARRYDRLATMPITIQGAAPIGGERVQVLNVKSTP